MCQACITATLPDVQWPDGYIKIRLSRVNDEIAGQAGSLAVVPEAMAHRLVALGHAKMST